MDRPVNPDYKWIQEPEEGKEAAISINGKLYSVNRDELGYILEYYSDEGATVRYRLNPAISACDCKDRQFRPHREGGCKHMVSLRNLIRELRAKRNQANG